MRTEMTVMKRVDKKTSLVTPAIRDSIMVGESWSKRAFSWKWIMAMGLMMRLAMSTWPPGVDIEPHRHWIEVTTQVKPGDWYNQSMHSGALKDDGNFRGSPSSKIYWWPLDYPPLSGIHAYFQGQLGKLWFNETEFQQNFGLFTSRGVMNTSLLRFMRAMVLLADLAVYFGGVVFLVNRLKQNVTCLLILQPLLIFVDHCHFQFNCVGYGLLLIAIGCVLEDAFFMAAFSFSLAVMYKQTMLYFAPAFAFVALGRINRGDTRIFSRGMGGLLLGIGVCLAPILGELSLRSDGGVWRAGADGVGKMMESVFPFKRGIFENYVATFWSLIFPILRSRWSREILYDRNLLLPSFMLTIAGVMEAGWKTIKNPTNENFMVSLCISSLSFFLFSWQVHEKAIISVLISLTIASFARPFLAKYVVPMTIVGFYSCLSLYLLEHRMIVPAALVHLVCMVPMMVTCRCDWRVVGVLLAVGTLVGFGVYGIIPPPHNRVPYFWLMLLTDFCSLPLFWLHRKLVRALM
jgi:alpha-1,3-glucosyltransferase